ncbi:DUF1573 domain-containing protein [Paenibacillus turpanensis]|uniref:DUF1573 domain-containing protein n=1 Tax=Paenibacillus turpanensis TaxID=2689078 RepID=UPI00140DD952|nr:DUF1573 domain-containing protein [Paenibacillus turpanensis]
MSKPSLTEFQSQVEDLLLRHRSLLDVMSKFQQSNATVNRSVTKAVTECGCISINAHRQKYDVTLNGDDLKTVTNTHVTGDLCEHCVDTIKNELGKNLFYMTSLCNLLNIQLDEVVAEEADKCSTLGFFKMT